MKLANSLMLVMLIIILIMIVSSYLTAVLYTFCKLWFLLDSNNEVAQALSAGFLLLSIINFTSLRLRK